MAISVQVPKDLSGIKTKVALNLTKRQIICFSGAAVAGIPLYFLTKGLIGTSAASLLMMGVMLPFFFFAMYEKNGFPAEKILYFMLRQKILTPGIRPYRSENLYKQLEEKEKLRREVRCPMELSTYFRINAANTGQFERTLIRGAGVADDVRFDRFQTFDKVSHIDHQIAFNREVS